MINLGLTPIDQQGLDILTVSIIAMALAVLASFVMATRVSHALSLLVKSAQRVQRFDFSA